MNLELTKSRLQERLYSHRTAQAAVIAGVILLGILMGRAIPNYRGQPVTLVAIALGMVAILGWMRGGSRGEIGVVAIALAGGLLNFFTLPTGTQSRLVISLVLALIFVGAWIVELLSGRRGTRLVTTPVNKPLILFVIVNFVSYFWGYVMRDPILSIPNSFAAVQLGALAVNILLPLLALYTLNKLDDVRWIRRLTWIMIGLGVFKLIATRFDLPVNAMIDNGSRGLFATWVGGLAYAEALFDNDLARWKRGLLLAFVALWIYWYAIEYVLWFSGWVPLVVECIIITMARSKKLFAALMLVLGVYVLLNLQFYSHQLYVAKEQEGDLERITIWQMNLEHVRNHPVFGMGPAGYAIYNMTYHPQDGRSTHNGYFDVLAQTGVVGLAIFIWLFIAFIGIGIRTARWLQGRHDWREAFAAAALAGGVAALVSIMLGDWVLPFAYNQTISGFDNAAFTWILLGALVSLYRLLRPATPAPALAKTEERA